MIAAIVAPAGVRSIARMRACLVSGRVELFGDECADRERGLDLLVVRAAGRVACLVWWRGAPSGVLPPLLRRRRRERGRPTRLTRSLPLHAGKASTRSSDSGRRLSWCGSGPCDGRHHRTATLPADGRTCYVRRCDGTIGRGISFGPLQTARDP